MTLPEASRWCWHAKRIGGGWIDRDLPASAPKFGPVLSGAAEITATIDPVYEHLKAGDGRLQLEEWGTLIVLEADNRVKATGILTGVEAAGQALTLTVKGFSAYPDGQPLTDPLTWGGKTAGLTGNGADPAQVYQRLWEWVQSHPDANLGVTVSNTTTPYRVGEWYNARKLPDENTPNPGHKEVNDPIPIDRVWTSKDKKPAAATGLKVYWQYQLLPSDTADIGAKADELFKAVPIEFVEQSWWADEDKSDVRLHIQLGHPRLGRKRPDLVFAEDENLVGDPITVSRTADEYANVIRVLGAGEGTKQTTVEVVQRDGRLRRVAVVDAGDISSKSALTAIGKQHLARRVLLDDITGLTVDAHHPNAPFSEVGVGDDIPVSARVGWRRVDMWVRVTAMDYDVAAGTYDITCSRSDGFDYSGGGGIGGP